MLQQDHGRGRQEQQGAGAQGRAQTVGEVVVGGQDGAGDGSAERRRGCVRELMARAAHPDGADDLGDDGYDDRGDGGGR
ncbi:hypothetical protein [Streptomyces anandii]|uniref:hypothetical protein n=1 Tax=Streptomyces anandii TaxID=285454 RepID=UPI00379B26E3